MRPRVLGADGLVIRARNQPLSLIVFLRLAPFPAITIGVRILGPALGFILGSLCTRLYADLSVDPQITPNDPRWVGAWWLGESRDSLESRRSRAPPSHDTSPLIRR